MNSRPNSSRRRARSAAASAAASADPNAPAVHEAAVELIVENLTRQGVPREAAEIVTSHLEPVMIDVARDPAQPIVMLAAQGSRFTFHRFPTIEAGKVFARENEAPGRTFAGVDMARVLSIAADYVATRDALLGASGNTN